MRRTGASATIVIIWVLALLAPASTTAQDQDTIWVRENLLKECHRRHTCWRYFHPQNGWSWSYWGYRRVNYRRRYNYDRYEDWRGRRYERAHDRYEDNDPLPHCRPTVIATGHEALSRPEAKEQGELAWMEEVRGKWGARYMDPRNARDLSYECYRSSTGNRVSEKVGDLIGKFLEQCRIEAVPCRAEKEYADEETRREQSRNLYVDDNRRPGKTEDRLRRRFDSWWKSKWQRP
jgi:hypothetical protein